MTQQQEMWSKAQEHEAAWWRSEGFGCVNSYHEELKQLVYAERMGIKIDEWHRIDLEKKSVLDVGGGPVSLLLKAYNGRRKVIDPLDMPEWVLGRYKEAGIEVTKRPAEDMDEHGWDEVWLYNCLQHVQDPEKVIAKIKQSGKIVRVFEFLERPTNEQHPHRLTAERLDRAFDRRGTVGEIGGSIVGKVYYGAFEYDTQFIPEIHWVSTGTDFPYAYYLAIESALRTQKAQKFNLWLTVEPESKYYDIIKDRVTIRHLGEMPGFPALRGRDGWFIKAHLADYYRWQILYEEGGIFCDLDSLSVKDYCAEAAKALEDKDFIASCVHEDKTIDEYAQSWFAGKKQTSIAKQLLDGAIKYLNKSEGFVWGDSGPKVMSEVCALNPEVVYKADYGLHGSINEHYELYKPDGKLPDNITFIHLYAHVSNAYWGGITEEYIKTSDHLYAKLVRRVMNMTELLELNWVNTGTEFPYPYYLAIMSALKTQKASKFNLWLAKEPAGKYYDLIKDRVTLRHMSGAVPDFPALENQKPGFKEAHLVDFFRWLILYEQGGIFCDLDSFSLKDYTEFISESLNDGKEFLASLVQDKTDPKPYQNSIFAGKKGSELVKKMMDECVKRLNNATGFEWGNSGPDVLNKLCVENPDKVAQAEYGMLGGWLEMYQLWKPDGILPENARFLHLWKNSINGYWTNITENYIENSTDVYPKLVREILTKEERIPLSNQLNASLGEHTSAIGPPGIPSLNDFINSRGQHYRPLFKYLKSHECKHILEIGTYDGENAVRMIKTAAEKVSEKHISYYGFDLFDEITPEKINLEFSHPKPPPMLEVKAGIKQKTKAKITLFQGDTKKTLKENIKTLPSMDLIYIDGGHSIDTVRNDWHYAAKLMKPTTVVFFDDYFPELPFIGCKFLLDEIDKTKYDVEIMPEIDDYPKEWGRLRIQLLAVQLKDVSAKRVSIVHTDKPALHILGLAHTKTDPSYNACAYSMKCLKLCSMMRKLGYEVYHYGAEGSTPDCTEHITVVSNEIQRQTYGDYDWHKEMFKHDPKDLAYTTFNQNAIREINARKGPRDLLLVTMGNYQKTISDSVGMMAFESGIGYSGVFLNKRVFESYAWMHTVLGTLSHDANADGNYYDAVIPNFYDPNEFEFCDKSKREDYYLYLGRLIPRKGVHIAAQVCEKLGKRLVIAGQGTEETLTTLGIDPKKVEFVGYADVKKRSDLMAHAKAIFVPTLYIEPFGGVNVEAALTGCPCICTDFGGFTETVYHGKTGYRCHTFDDFIWAAKNVDKLDCEYIRSYAVNNFSMDRVALQYDEYIKKLMDLYKNGWYEIDNNRKELDWLNKWY